MEPNGKKKIIKKPSQRKKNRNSCDMKCDSLVVIKNKTFGTELNAFIWCLGFLSVCCK